jgi:hypothetical protein
MFPFGPQFPPCGTQAWHVPKLHKRPGQQNGLEDVAQLSLTDKQDGGGVPPPRVGMQVLLTHERPPDTVAPSQLPSEQHDWLRLPHWQLPVPLAPPSLAHVNPAEHWPPPQHAPLRYPHPRHVLFCSQTFPASHADPVQHRLPFPPQTLHKAPSCTKPAWHPVFAQGGCPLMPQVSQRPPNWTKGAWHPVFGQGGVPSLPHAVHLPLGVPGFELTPTRQPLGQAGCPGVPQISAQFGPEGIVTV